MALKSLKTAAMVSVSEAWLDPHKDRPLLERLALVKPLIPSLEAAHADLLASQPKSTSAPSELEKIQAAEAEADATHDRKLRGLHAVLTGLGDLSDDAAATQGYLDLRDHLFPQGLQGGRLTYGVEAGNVALVDGRLTDADRKLIRDVALPQRTLGDEVNAWKQAGERLGELERQRAQLPGAPGPTRSDAVQARNTWIRVVSAVLGNLALEKDLDDAKRQKLLGLLERLEAQSDRRQPAKGSDASSGTDPAPAAGSGSGS